MAFFKSNDTNKVVWYDKQYNTDYMDGIVDLLEDCTECYLVSGSSITEQGPLFSLWDDYSENLNDTIYIIPSEFYEEATETVSVVKDDYVESVDLSEPEEVPDGFHLVRAKESPVYVYKTPKDRYKGF